MLHYLAFKVEHTRGNRTPEAPLSLRHVNYKIILKNSVAKS